MNLRTKIEISKSNVDINHQSKLMMFGSCFSQNIGQKLLDNKFQAIINPFGILYNPSSIASSIKRLLSHREFEQSELVFHNEMYQSFMHHGSFSSNDKDKCITDINKEFNKSGSFINNTDTYLFTFGTAYTYKLNETGDVVANCHKFHASNFTRYRLSVEDIVNEWTNVIDNLLAINSKAKFVFTVSPIRHWKDGAHDNVISKSILHIAIDSLQTMYPDSLLYFPAYEILMDELRDYRFYAEDMMHPSSLAIEYIWQRFGDAFFSSNTLEISNKWMRISQAINHRPINAETNNYNNFLKQTLKRVVEFNKNYPYIDCDKEREHLIANIKL